MTVKEKVLDLIGLEGMSNREALLEELSELTSEQLEMVLFGHKRETDRLQTILGEYQCDACQRIRGGKPPCETDDDVPCALDTAAWLDLPCERDRLVDWSVVFDG